jgi:hypothetical protein
MALLTTCKHTDSLLDMYVYVLYIYTHIYIGIGIYG